MKKRTIFRKRRLSRRRLLSLFAAIAIGAILAGCRGALPSPTPTALPTPTASPVPIALPAVTESGLELLGGKHVKSRGAKGR